MYATNTLVVVYEFNIKVPFNWHFLIKYNVYVYRMHIFKLIYFYAELALY